MAQIGYAGTAEEQHRLAGFIARGLAAPNVREAMREYFTIDPDGVYACCALGYAAIGSCDGDAAKAYKIFQEGRGSARARFERMLKLPPRLVGQADSVHMLGTPAAQIAEELAAELVPA